jgi:hypothetical protein
MSMNLAETVLRLKEYWGMLFPSAPVPSDEHWALWLLAHDEAQVKDALTVLATRVLTGTRQIAREDLHKFVMGLLIRSREKAAEKKSSCAPHSQYAVPNTSVIEVNGNR